MSEFRKVCLASEVPEGEGKPIEVDGKQIAVFQCNGQFHAIDDMCPHMGAPLSAGYVEDGIVTCPWHAWRFRLADGVWADNPRIKIGCYPLRVEDGAIHVQVDPPPPQK